MFDSRNNVLSESEYALSVLESNNAHLKCQQGVPYIQYACTYIKIYIRIYPSMYNIYIYIYIYSKIPIELENTNPHGHLKGDNDNLVFTPQIIVVSGCFGFNSHGSRWWFRRRGTYLHGVHPLDPAISFCSAEGPTLFEPLKGMLEHLSMAIS